MLEPLSPQQLRLLHFICDHKREHDGCAPTIREMQAALGLASTSGIRLHLAALERKGYIFAPLKAARVIEVRGGTWTPPSPPPLPMLSIRHIPNEES